MKAHDANGDNKLQKEEHLFPQDGTAARRGRRGTRGGAEHSGWAEHMAVPSDDEAGDEGDDDGEAELHAESSRGTTPTATATSTPPSSANSCCRRAT